MDVDLVSQAGRLLVGYEGDRLPQAQLDAIVVPSVRRAANLQEASQLAAATDAVLVVVCSSTISALAAARGLDRDGWDS